MAPDMAAITAGTVMAPAGVIIADMAIITAARPNISGAAVAGAVVAAAPVAISMVVAHVVTSTVADRGAVEATVGRAVAVVMVPAARVAAVVAMVLVDRAAVAATVVAVVTAGPADIDAYGRFRLRNRPFFIRASPHPTAGS